MNACVSCLLVVDLLGLWRGVKPVSLRQGGLWRGFISRKPKLLLTNDQHTHSPSHALIIYPPNPPSVHSPTNPFTRPIHSPTHPFTHSIHSPIHSPTHSFTHRH